jgi:hypothetical protein
LHSWATSADPTPNPRRISALRTLCRFNRHYISRTDTWINEIIIDNSGQRRNLASDLRLALQEGHVPSETSLLLFWKVKLESLSEKNTTDAVRDVIAAMKWDVRKLEAALLDLSSDESCVWHFMSPACVLWLCRIMQQHSFEILRVPVHYVALAWCLQDKKRKADRLRSRDRQELISLVSWQFLLDESFELLLTDAEMSLLNQVGKRRVQRRVEQIKHSCQTVARTVKCTLLLVLSSRQSDQVISFLGLNYV